MQNGLALGRLNVGLNWYRVIMLASMSGGLECLKGVGEGRGFTDHEHLNLSGLIHMNGRAYDPLIARFVSPDPFIQSPYRSQSYKPL